MRTSTKLSFSGLIVASALCFGAIGARADNPNGPDAGIGIPGYNLDYNYAADGSGPGYPRHPELQHRHHEYSSRKYAPHHYHQW